VLLREGRRRHDPAGFAACSAASPADYFERFGDQSDAIAAIAAKNHANGASNPYAHMQRDLGFDFCRNESEKNPFVAGPLKRTDCSMVSDGAAALIISAGDAIQGRPNAIRFRSFAPRQRLPAAQQA
jgi:acetyl-CoA C-acetyltransferase